MSARENHPTREKATRGGERGVSPFLAWGDFHARSRFARSTIPEEKWGLLVVYYIVVLWPQKRYFERFGRILSSPFTGPLKH